MDLSQIFQLVSGTDIPAELAETFLQAFESPAKAGEGDTSGQ